MLILNFLIQNLIADKQMTAAKRHGIVNETAKLTNLDILVLS